jgi:protease I
MFITKQGTMAKVLSVIAPQGYQGIEYDHSKKALEVAGHTVVTASTSKKAKAKDGSSFQVDLLLKNVEVGDYDAILFVGGPGVYDYFEDAHVLGLAKKFLKAGKIVSAICAAPSILANAGLLKGVKATCYPSQAANLKDKGAHYTGHAVVQDGQIITADGPNAAKAFGEKIAEALNSADSGVEDD